MSWFKSLKAPKVKEKSSESSVKVPEGFWMKCTSCGEILQARVLKENFQVCPECQFHFRMSAEDRLRLLIGPDEFEEWDSELHSTDPLLFSDTKPYPDRLQAAFRNTGRYDAVITGQGSILDVKSAIGIFEFQFMGGSMGSVVGERLVRLFERALDEKLPTVVVSSSGGARMQEGILSLMQLARTSSLVGQLKKAKVPYVSVLADPTTGGVAASFAMLGDVILAEPKALIGFAGPRVIEQTIRQSLPQGFQRAEFLVNHGFVDSIVHRKDLPGRLAWIFKHLSGAHLKSSRKKKTSPKSSSSDNSISRASDVE